MKELIMEFFGNSKSAIEAIINDVDTDSSFSEAQKDRDEEIDKCLAIAAFRNEIAGAGTTITTGVSEDLDISGVDLRTASAMLDDPMPVPLIVEDGTAYFQATTTSALAIRATTAIEVYGERRVTPAPVISLQAYKASQNTKTDHQSIAAD